MAGKVARKGPRAPGNDELADSDDETTLRAARALDPATHLDAGRLLRGSGVPQRVQLERDDRPRRREGRGAGDERCEQHECPRCGHLLPLSRAERSVKWLVRAKTSVFYRIFARAK